MTTSLPRIKTLVQNSQSGSQKQLKFRKLKLTTDEPPAEIRERFKSVRTERLSSLQRYSSVQGQREYKKQKIHLNLLERKLLSGTYDQTKETGNDLNSLKQKTDYYKTQSLQKQSETERIRVIIEQLKLESASFEGIKKKNQQIVAKAQKKYEGQKIKSEAALYEKQTFEHMIDQRKKINQFLESQINEDKAYVLKLKNVIKQVQNEARESTQNMKNLFVKVDKLNEQALREQRTREEMIYEKQSVISKRKDDQNLRLQKSKQFKRGLDQAEEQHEMRDFMDHYKAILAQVFFQKYSKARVEALQQKYQGVENMFSRISSYKKFDKSQPAEMIQRFQQLQPERLGYEEVIKKLQKQQAELEGRNKDLRRARTECQILAGQQQDPSKMARSRSVYLDVEESQRRQKMHERNVESVGQEIKGIRELMFRIEKWGERYAQELEIKYRKGESIEDVGKNITNIVKVVQKEAEGIEGRGKAGKPRAVDQ